MMKIPIAITILILPLCVKSTCPKEYLAFSKDHSYCIPANENCQFIEKGLQNKEEEINNILQLHNDYRSKVAMGNEKGGGGLPTASNMLELTWSKELASIAQKWAEQCVFRHDCNDCREVKRFIVGQNIGESTCTGCDKFPADWKKIIDLFINEVKYFNKDEINSFQKTNVETVGHFTQAIWAKTYKIGCGYVSFQEKSDQKTQIYVCNYGPSGNVENDPIYIAGPTCSKCPKNSCCGKACNQNDVYAGLCRMTN